MEPTNTEIENNSQNTQEKNDFNPLVLNVPQFDCLVDGLDNRTFYGDSEINLTSDIAANEKQNLDSEESKNIPEEEFIKSFDLCAEKKVRNNGFADSAANVKDKVEGYKKKKEFISDDKEKSSEADNKETLSGNDLVNCAESAKDMEHHKMFDKFSEDNASHESLSEEKPEEKIKEGSKNEGIENMSDTKMDNLVEDDDTICGFSRFRPKWLQQWATPKSYLVLYSIAGVFQGSYFSYLVATMSTLEKRFAFKSKISGVIMMIDEITPLILGILVGYLAGKAHRPRMVALGLFLTGLCCLFFAIPFFIYGPGQHLVYSNSTGPEVCDFQQKREQCDEDDRPPTLAAIVFMFVGSFLKGFGNLAYHAIGLSYLDDCAEKKNTPVYFGITYAMKMLGPTFGYLMSSACLNIYENLLKDPGFDNEDPRWIGAWWLGFVLQAVFLIIISIPIMMFPRRLPSQRKVNQHLKSKSGEESFTQRIKGLPAGLKRLTTNKVYVFMALESIFQILSGLGYGMLLPKYMENQFRLSASDSSLYSGPAGLVAALLSTVIGSLIIWKVRLSIRGIIGGRAISGILRATVYLFMIFITCPGLSFAVTSSVNIPGNGIELQNECNKDCLCTTKVFTPLCGPDGVSTYFSSCHAGCSEALPEDIYGHEVFGNCSCILGENGSFINVEKMTKGYCPHEGCWTQAKIYITMLPVLGFITSFFAIGDTIILLRAIDPQDKCFALGSFESFLSLFGLIPTPLIFGALADSACLIWEFSCGVTGNCWVYDTQKFNYLLHGVVGCLCFAMALCNIRVLFLSHKIRDPYKEEYEDDDETMQENNDKELSDSAPKIKVQYEVKGTIL